MTYTYSSLISSVRLLGLARLLGMWRASIYKLVFREIIIYIGLFAVISVIYRVLLKGFHRKRFEEIVVYCTTFEGVLPLTFVLGFYVTFVAQRWWNQYSNIPWPDRIMTYVATLVEGDSEEAVMVRRSLMRYLMLSQVMLLQSISKPIQKRFPNLHSLVDQGLMTEDELMDILDENVPNISNKYWVPTQWCGNLLMKARKDRFIRDNFSFNTLLNELSLFKQGLGTIFSYDWINIPLVYTQVATISVYIFFFTTLISRQFIDWKSVKEDFGEHAATQYKVDMYFPFFTIVQLFFYLGWLKVAEQMLNPFGEDDDDFECNWIIDRNFKVGMFAVDNMYMYHPPLVKDQYWDTVDPSLSYTAEAERYRMPDGWFGSIYNLDDSQIIHRPHQLKHLRSISENDKQQTEPEFDSSLTVHFEDGVTGNTPTGSPVKQVRRLPPMMSMDNLDQLKRSVKRVPTTASFSQHTIDKNIIEEGRVKKARINLPSPTLSQKFLIGSAPHGLSHSHTTPLRTLNSQSALTNSSDCDSTTPLVKSDIIHVPQKASSSMNDSDTESTTPLIKPTSTVIKIDNAITEEEYVQQWMTDSNNDFGDDLLSSQVLSSSACQLSHDQPDVPTASEIYEQPPAETASVGDLSEVIVSQEMNDLLNPEITPNMEKRVAFEPDI